MVFKVLGNLADLYLEAYCKIGLSLEFRELEKSNLVEREHVNQVIIETVENLNLFIS